MRGQPQLVTGEGTVVLWDADGTLFPSEGPAFEASAVVTNRLLASLGSPERWTADDLRSVSRGKTFRSLAIEFSQSMASPLGDEELEAWVERENEAVMDHLARTLRPDPAVLEAVGRVASTYGMAVVSSSKLQRLAMCFSVTALDRFLPVDVHFSAQDSLPRPTSKPDPSVYLHAVNELGVNPSLAIAIEDAATGVASAVCAGLQTVGCLVFVPESERQAHGEALLEAGAAVVVESWAELGALLPTHATKQPQLTAFT